MKKVLAVLLAMMMIFTAFGCDITVEVGPSESDETPSSEEQNDDVMSWAEYIAAADDDPVVVEFFVQGHQSWWDNKITVYGQDEDGGYLAYEMVCSEEDSAKLVPGTKIRVEGFKTTWSGEVEIASGCTFELIEDETREYYATDITEEFGTDEMDKYMNMVVGINGLKVVAKKDTDGNDAAFLYKHDGSGNPGDDLYYDVELNGQTYTFTVESYLCGQDTDVYKAVEGLQVGDTIDIEGFLYWYNGPQPHTTKVTVK